MKKLLRLVSIILSLLMSCIFMYEPLSVFASEPTEIFARIKNTPPTISDDGTKIILPQIEDCGYEVKLYGSSNESVIGMDGTIYQPLEDMTVKVMYELVSITNPEDRIIDNFTETSIVIPGKYTAEKGDNAKPNVVPGLREWKGHSGNFVLTENSRLVVADESLLETADMIAYYFKEMLKTDIDVVSGTANAGDIHLALNDKAELGSEGYEIEIADKVTVGAYTNKGVLYAGTSITQILYQSADKATMPKGLVRDYPQYEVRGIGFDLGRFYMPLDYLEEVTKYMAYFKVNEARIHLNDDYGEQIRAFRIESKKYPIINSALNPLEVYSQEDYKNYQKEVKKFGVDVISEIDTPAHSGFAYLYDTNFVLSTNSTYLDLENPDVLPFIKSLFDEFLDGEDPVFQSDTFHIGTDEYTKDKSELVRAYMDELINYVSDKGLDVRMWASLGTNGFAGETPVSNNATVNHWAKGWASIDEMIDAGYNVINNYGPYLYAVPGKETPYSDYINFEGVYNYWEANQCEITIPESSPNFKGSEAFFWYDSNVGASEFDAFDRIKDQIMLMAEKNWYGPKTEGQTGAEFIERVSKVDKYAPGSNPGRYVESEDKTVASYDFEVVDGEIVNDSTNNGYNGTIKNLSVATENDNSYLALDGAGYLSLPFGAIGFPYTVSFDLFIENNPAKNAVLFSGEEGTLYLNHNGTGKIGYKRKSHTFIFDAVIETGKWQNFSIACDNRKATLTVDGNYVCEGDFYIQTLTNPETWQNYIQTPKYKDSTTFVLPVAEIGKGVVGKLDNLTILNECEVTIPEDPQPQKYLGFKAEDMKLIGDGTGFNRWGNEAEGYTTYMTTVSDYSANPGYATIRKFVAPKSGTFKVDTEYGTGLTMGNQTSHDNYPVSYAIADKEGKILFPTNGQLGTLTYSNPIRMSAPLTMEIEEGDPVYFIMIGSASVAMPMSFRARVFIDSTEYDTSGNLRGSSYNVQGENGWYYQYATSVTVGDEPQLALNQKYLKYDAKDMVLLGDGTAWSRWGDTAENYTIFMSTGGSYTTGKGYATINKFVVPEGTTTVKIDTKYTTGITTGNSEAHDVYPIKYAITDKEGKILWPISGKLGTVTFSKPATINGQLVFETKAGDEFNFILINDFGGNLPMTFNARVLDQNDNYLNYNGNLRTQSFNTQGEGGWYYQYATSVEELDEIVEEPEIPVEPEEPELEITTNVKVYSTYVLGNLVDGTTQNFTWLAANQKAGQYIQFKFGTAKTLTGVQILSDVNKDCLSAADVEISEDGQQWTTVGSLTRQATQTVTFSATKAKYVRIILTADDSSSWWKICEVSFKEAVEGDVDGSGTLDANDVTALINRILNKESNENFAYDINGDGKVDIRDLARLKVKLANIAK